MKTSVRHLVRQRACGRCEYCGLPENVAAIAAFHIEHVRAKCHRGDDFPGNLAFACHFCNWYKGTNLAGIDPKTRRLTALFHPRRHRWTTHFRYRRAVLVGLTAIGRATIATLKINHPDAVRTRESLIDEGVWEPMR